MTALEQKTYTADEFWEFVAQPENAERFFELLEGTIVELAASSAAPAILAAEFVRLMGNHVRERNLGYVAGADGGFILSPKNVLAPDAAYISKERQPKLPDRFFTAAPDLAVEVVSPTDSMKKVHRKALRYIKYGVRLVWVVYPDDKTVDAYMPSVAGDATVQEIGIDGVLDGGEVLPGFTLPVRDLFKVVEQ
jgi:Uma2 family endonuclease